MSKKHCVKTVLSVIAISLLAINQIYQKKMLDEHLEGYYKSNKDLEELLDSIIDTMRGMNKNIIALTNYNIEKMKGEIGLK